MWDLTIQCDQYIAARKPKYCSGDRVKSKEIEKIEKFQLLKDEIAYLWRMRKVCIILIVIGALRVVTKDFRQFVERLEAPDKLEVILKTVLLGTAIFIKVFKQNLDIKQISAAWNL